MKNKKGLSTIVATLMIILLTIVAFAIIATVITRNIKKDVGKMDLSSQCLDVHMQIIKVTKDGPDGQFPVKLNIKIKRDAGGEKIAGYLLSIANSTSNQLINKAGNFAPLKETTIAVSDTENTMLSVTSVSITPYLTDSTGDKYNCPASQEFVI